MPKIPRFEPWQHRFVEANGLRFHVVTAGPADGGRSRGLVLLLHGFPEFWYSWRRQIPGMAAAGFDGGGPAPWATSAPASWGTIGAAQRLTPSPCSIPR